jgi:RNA polymerase sigma-70 factor (ECF subfamily)
MIDQVRRNKKMVQMPEEFDGFPVTNNGYTDTKQIVNEALEKLPEIQKSVILLRDYEGYDYKEIGEITNLTESQVKVYIFRARVFLKQYIGSLEKVI